MPLQTYIKIFVFYATSDKKSSSEHVLVFLMRFK